MAFATAALKPSFLRRGSRVAIRTAESYKDDLASLLFETLQEFDLQLRGKTVVLKPNFVGHDLLGCVNTHPAVVAAARECFLKLGAASVVVGEGPALERDTEAILEGIRLREFLGPLRGVFVDLNLDAVHEVTLRTHASSLRRLYLPATVLRADFVVSLPKLKTHHWTGVTLSLKNLFGIVPGSCYGWPKNILHWAGIAGAVLDINSAVRPDFAIVDGIVGMEGDGPTQGEPKTCGVLVMGDDPVAVDATCARVMGLVPERIGYLERAGLLLGHVKEEKIEQIGERIARVRTPFRVMDDFHHLKQ
jgi:uncharacterized protein (DUF362 family)